MDAPEKNLTKRAGIVSAGTFASRILGLLRESIMAAIFPKEAIDVFQVAFMIPNSFRRLTAEGAFSISVTTVYAKLRATADADAQKQFLSALYGFSITFLGILAILGSCNAYWLTKAAGPGFVDIPGKFELATSLTRTMFPYIFFISLTSLAMGLLNASGHFFSPAFAPVFLNLSIIASMLGLSGWLPAIGLAPVYALAFGVLAGGVLQLALQLPSLRRLGLLARPTFTLRNPHLRRVIRLTLPMILGAAAYILNLYIASAFASGLGEGAVTYIGFSSRLMELPLAVLVMAISTAALPSLAALRGQGRTDDMKQVYNHAIRLGLLVATPAMIGLWALAEPIIVVIYQRGRFSYEDAVNTAHALKWLALGMCSVALLRQTVPVFYAIERVRIPVIMTLVNIVVYVVSALILRGPYGYVGLCMALALSTTIQALALVVILRLTIGKLGMGRVALNWLRLLAASAVMGAAAWGVAHFGQWSLGGNAPRNIAVLAIAMGVSLIVYAACCWLFRVGEFLELARAIQRKVRRT